MKHLTLTVAIIAALGSSQLIAQHRDYNGPMGPAPVNAAGRIMLGAPPAETKGVWTPLFGTRDPIAPVETIPFQPWAKSLYDARQLQERDPHARC
jgi:hypothetical protein